MSHAGVRRALAGAVLSLIGAGPCLAFQGRVILPDGSPVAGASVSIVGLPGSARTDAAGRFTWQPDPTPPFEVLILLPSGQAMPPVRVETWPESGPLDVRVEPAMIETVTVTPGAAPHIEAPPGGATDSLAREDFEQRHSLHLADILENIPGAGDLEEGHSAVPTLRGLARGRTLVLLDGARVTAERRAGPSATYLDPIFLESVEVSRGPGSVAYGSDALGGVIHARTRRPAPGTPLRIAVQGSLGAGIPERAAGVELEQGVGQGAWLLSVRGRDFEDYDSPEGEVFDSGARDAGFLGRLSHPLASGILSVGLQTDMGRDIGKPSLTSEAIRSYYPREDSYRLTVSHDLAARAGFRRLGWDAFFGTYRLMTNRDRAPTAIEPRRLASSDTFARDYALRGTAERNVGASGLTFGFDLHGRSGLEAEDTVTDFDAGGAVVSETEEQSIEDARSMDAALYASLEAPVARRVLFSGGLRLGSVSASNQGGYFGDDSRRSGVVAGHAAMTFDLPKGLAITAQVARGFRDPTLSDRYFRGVSGRGFVIGNPDLEPETSVQADVALRFTGRIISYALYGYRYRIDNLVERYESAPGEFTFRNRGEALLQGGEFEVQARAGSGLTVTAGAQVASGEALDDGSPLDDSPATGATITLRQELRGRGYILARGAAYARDDDPGPTEKATPGYGVIDLGGGWRVNAHLELRVLLRNVTDISHFASSDAAAVLAAGRAGLLTFIASF